MDMQLAGKTALVTGASQGLGRAIVKSLAAEGVKVFATARNEELLVSLVGEITDAGGIAPITFVQDFVAADGPERIASAALAAMGHIDITVNNAGGSRPMDIDAPEEQWIEGMTLNFDRHRQLTQNCCQTSFSVSPEQSSASPAILSRKSSTRQWWLKPVSSYGQKVFLNSLASTVSR